MVRVHEGEEDLFKGMPAFLECRHHKKVVNCTLGQCGVEGAPLTELSIVICKS